MKLKRIWHRYEKWEDLEMWRKVTDEAEHLQRAIEFTGNAELYGSYMRRVINEWPISCEHNLTNPGMNQKAWLGHAAVQMAIQCPEYITRQAWKYLTQEQQGQANHQAVMAIVAWREHYGISTLQHSLEHG